MLPLRCLTVGCLVVSLFPVLVVPQLYLKKAVCILSMGVFIYQGCAEVESIVCRLIALELKIINCRGYPCVNYDSPEQNKCADFPIGCPLEYIKLFGICPPFKICCGTGGLEVRKWRKNRGLKRLELYKNKRSAGDFTQLQDVSTAPPATAIAWNQTAENSNQTNSNFTSENFPPENFPPDYNLPKTPEDIVKDWPKNVTDPKVLEKAFKVQYERFRSQVDAINLQELAGGEEFVRIVSYEDFKAVGLGQKKISDY